MSSVYRSLQRTPLFHFRNMYHLSSESDTHFLFIFYFSGMTRVTRGYVARRRRNKIFHAVRGCRAGRVRLFRTAQQQALKSRAYMYTSRKNFKRSMRRVWIKRINAGVRSWTGTSRGPKPMYSTCIHMLHQHACRLNRKSLAQLASLEPVIFHNLLDITYG